MRAALISPLHQDWENRRSARAMYSFPSGLGYIAAVLRRAGHEARIFIPDSFTMPMSKVWAEVAAFKPDVVGATAVTSSFMEARRVIAEAKRRFGCMTVMGGQHPTALPRSTLLGLPELDAVVVGEGELPMLALAEEFSKGKPDLAKIPGAAYLKDGQYCENPRPAPIADLDSLPPPALDLLNGPFFDPDRSGDRRSAKIVTSRGCPGQCTFCANICMGRKFRAHTPERVVDEMARLNRDHGVNNFRIHDDCFTADRQRVLDICALIVKEDLRVTWDAAARVNTLQDEEVVAAMKRAGCTLVQLGIETGNRRIGELMKKGTTLEMAERCCALLRRHGLAYMNSYLIGSEEETPETALDTMRFAEKLASELAVFAVVTPYPGTPLFDKFYKEFDRPDTDWTRWSGHGPSRPYQVRHTRLTHAQLWRLMLKAHARYYLAPSRLLRMAAFVLK